MRPDSDPRSLGVNILKQKKYLSRKNGTRILKLFPKLRELFLSHFFNIFSPDSQPGQDPGNDGDDGNTIDLSILLSPILLRKDQYPHLHARKKDLVDGTL